MDSIKSKNLDFKSSLANNKICCAFAVDFRPFRAMFKVNTCMEEDKAIAWKNADWECVVIFSRHHKHLYGIVATVFKEYFASIPSAATGQYFMIACKSGLRSQVPIDISVSASKSASSGSSKSESDKPDVPKKKKSSSVTSSSSPFSASSASSSAPAFSSSQPLQDKDVMSAAVGGPVDRNIFPVKKSRNQIQDPSPEKSDHDSVTFDSDQSNPVQSSPGMAGNMPVPDVKRTISNGVSSTGGNTKIMEQIDYATNAVVATFYSQTEAFKKTGIPTSSINDCLHGRMAATRGFTFRFKGASVVGSERSVDAGAPSLIKQGSHDPMMHSSSSAAILSADSGGGEGSGGSSELIRSGPLPYSKSQPLINRQPTDDRASSQIASAPMPASSSGPARAYKPSKTTGRFTGKDPDLGTVKPIRPPTTTQSSSSSVMQASTQSNSGGSSVPSIPGFMTSRVSALRGVNVLPVAASSSTPISARVSIHPSSNQMPPPKQPAEFKISTISHPDRSAALSSRPRAVPATSSGAGRSDAASSREPTTGQQAAPTSRFDELKQLLNAKSGISSIGSAAGPVTSSSFAASASSSSTSAQQSLNGEHVSSKMQAMARATSGVAERAVVTDTRPLIGTSGSPAVVGHRPPFSDSDSDEEEDDDDNRERPDRRSDRDGFDIDEFLHSVVDSIAADKERGNSAGPSADFRALKRHRADNEGASSSSSSRRSDARAHSSSSPPPRIVCAPDEFNEDEVTSSSDESAVPSAKKKRNRAERRKEMRENGWKSHQRRTDVDVARQLQEVAIAASAEHKSSSGS
jgi:hypothetical protein